MHAVTAADVGRRVSVRVRLHDDPDHATTDLLGELLAYADGVLEVDARRQGRTRVPEGDVLASRVVPDPPPRRRGADG